jgi:alpha-galactosidase
MVAAKPRIGSVTLRLRSIVAFGVVAAVVSGCAGQGEFAAPQRLTPPMGWNSWDSGNPLTEQSVEATIDAMVNSGMRDAGYRYVNLDAGWAGPTRGPDGQLGANSSRFPHGISGLARYAHDRGMLLGLYASPYHETCGQDPRIGSAGHEATDARTFAVWGVDYLKYDWCRRDADHREQVRVFTAMRDALQHTGRHILYSINPNSSSDHTAGVTYDWSGIADMMRNTTDLVPVWRSLLPPLGPTDSFLTGTSLGVPEEFAAAMPVAKRSRPGYWNDPDMLVVGLSWSDYYSRHAVVTRRLMAENHFTPERLDKLGPTLALSADQVAWRANTQPALTDTEQRTHFSLWAMLAAPLLAGNDVATMTEQTRAILTNRDVIAVDQDRLVAQASPLPQDSRILVKPLADGAVAVAFINFDAAPTTFTTTASAVGLSAASCYTVRDLWAHTDGHSTGDVTAAPVPGHGVVMLRISASCR